jgi:hypothetical protein
MQASAPTRRRSRSRGSSRREEGSDPALRRRHARGWAQYLKGGPSIEAANELIKKDNPEQTDDLIGHAIKELNARGIVRSGDALAGGIGAMSDRRWAEFYHSMTDVEVLPRGSTCGRPIRWTS